MSTSGLNKLTGTSKLELILIIIVVSVLFAVGVEYFIRIRDSANAIKMQAVSRNIFDTVRVVNQYYHLRGKQHARTVEIDNLEIDVVPMLGIPRATPNGIGRAMQLSTPYEFHYLTHPLRAVFLPKEGNEGCHVIYQDDGEITVVNKSC